MDKQFDGVCGECSKQWSAQALALASSIVACTLVGMLGVYALLKYIPPALQFGQWPPVVVVVVFLGGYIQLAASTLWRSPLTRRGDRITGMTYNTLGDGHVDMSVRQWVLWWFRSVLCWSVVFETVLVVTCGMIANP